MHTVWRWNFGSYISLHLTLIDLSSYQSSVVLDCAIHCGLVGFNDFYIDKGEEFVICICFQVYINCPY